MATYYALVFAISWGGMLVIALPDGIPAPAERVDPLMPAMLAAMFAGPSIGGVLMTWLVSGRAGVRELAARLLRWRVPVRWYAAVLLLPPLVVATVLLFLSLFSRDFVPGLITREGRLSLLVFGVAWGLGGGGLLEETGWTGFAVPRLRQAHGVMATGLIAGFLWGAWHLLVAVWASRGMAGDQSLALFVAGFLAFYAGVLPAYRVIMVWTRDRCDSLPVTMLMHASLSTSTLVLQPVATGVPFVVWNVALALVLWAIVAAGTVVARRRGSPPVPRGDGHHRSFGPSLPSA